MKKTVYVSGATSFTGAWIAKNFSNQGFSVYSSGSDQVQGYDEIRQKRYSLLKSFVKSHFALSDSSDLENSILNSKPEVFVFHHHYMKNYRSSDYEFDKAVEFGKSQADIIIRSLKSVNAKGIIYTGSYFEAGERGSQLNNVVTPYAASKTEVYNYLKSQCELHGLMLGKVVIPNPIGPLENLDRLIPTVVRKTLCKEKVSIPNPNLIANNIDVRKLADNYVSVALQSNFDKVEARPDGWMISTGALLQTCVVGLISQLTSDAPQIDFGTPLLEELAADHGLVAEMQDFWNFYYQQQYKK